MGKWVYDNIYTEDPFEHAYIHTVKHLWYKKERFNPETLTHFDKVLVRDTRDRPWICVIFSHVREEELKKQYISEKSLLERFGYHSVTTFEEWLKIKNKQV